MRRKLTIEKIGPALIFIALWLDGWLYPLLLLPFLYVILIEKKEISWLGFRKQELQPSISLGLLTATLLMVIHYPIFMQYIPLLEKRVPSLYDLFTDVVWYPCMKRLPTGASYLCTSLTSGLRASPREIFRSTLSRQLSFYPFTSIT